MRFPLDLEDIIGVAMADVVRRAGMFFGAILLGSFVGGTAVYVGECVAYRVDHSSWNLHLFDADIGSIMLLPLRPVFSVWGFLFIPLLLTSGFYHVRADDPGLRPFAVFTSLFGLLAVVGRGEPDWFYPSWFGRFYGMITVTNPGKLIWIMTGVGFAVWLALTGSLWFLLLFLEQRLRAGAEQHLAMVALENERRRQELREKFGTEIADADYVKGPPGEER